MKFDVPTCGLYDIRSREKLSENSDEWSERKLIKRWDAEIFKKKKRYQRPSSTSGEFETRVFYKTVSLSFRIPVPPGSMGK